MHITVKELLPIVIGAAVWGSRWRGLTVSCRCDNVTVVAIVNSGRSKVEKVMHLMRCLSFFLARWEVSLVCSHIPGILNGAAEALSRDALSSFQQLMPGASKVPTELPDSVLDCLVRGAPDWTNEEGLGDPFMPVLARLHYVLRGVKRAQGEAGAGRRERLPITPPILRKIRGVWGRAPDDPDYIMLWAACCLAFFGFLRAGELTVPNDSAFDPSVHLAWGDLAVDKPENTAVLSVRIKASKTDPFRRGITLYIGRVPSDLCPVSAVLAYLVSRKGKDGPLFIFCDGRPLTRQRFVVAVRSALKEAGVEAGHYAGHGFRIGAATTAVARGLEDSTVQTLGRWMSLVYLEYIRIPRHQLASYTARLC